MRPAGGLQRQDSFEMERTVQVQGRQPVVDSQPLGIQPQQQQVIVPVAEVIQPLNTQSRTVFRSFDTDGDGNVDLNEFRVGFDRHLANNVVKPIGVVPVDADGNPIPAMGMLETIETLPFALKRKWIMKSWGLQALQILFVFWTTYFLKCLKYRHGVNTDKISAGGMIPLLLMAVFVLMMSFLYMARAEQQVMVWLFPLYMLVEVLALGSFSWYTNYGFILHMLFYHFLATSFVGLLLLFEQKQLPKCCQRAWGPEPDQHMFPAKAGLFAVPFLLCAALGIYFASPAFLQVDPGVHDGQGVKTIIFAWIGISVIIVTQCWQYSKIERQLTDDQWFRSLCLSHAGMAIVVVIMCLCCTMFCIGGDAGMDGGSMDVTSGGEAAGAGGAEAAGAAVK